MGRVPDAPYVQLQCPVLKQYAPETERKLGRELRTLRQADPKAVTPGIVKDYYDTRTECRAIENKPPRQGVQ